MQRKTGIQNGFIFLAGILILIALGYFYFAELQQFYSFVSDREKIKAYIESFGAGAPVVFVSLQVLQVILAPIPGEASGIIGGYLFGSIPGFLLSTLGLTLGSAINLVLGRRLGKPFVKKMLPEIQYQKLSHLLTKNNLFVVLILFIIPGFPKDYLCLFLGISSISIPVLLVLAFLGRMPGTLTLSIQGSAVYHQSYLLSGIMFTGMLILVYMCYIKKDSINTWLDRLNHKN